VLFEPGWKLREAIKVFWTIPVTLRGPTPRIIVARATRCNSPGKCLSSSFSIAPPSSRRGMACRARPLCKRVETQESTPRPAPKLAA
jgi:hypothetical protein